MQSISDVIEAIGHSFMVSLPLLLLLLFMVSALVYSFIALFMLGIFSLLTWTRRVSNLVEIGALQTYMRTGGG